MRIGDSFSWLVSRSDQTRRASMSSLCRVYWYWAADWRPPRRNSCCTCRNRDAPATRRSLGRMRWATSSELSPPRSALGLRLANRKPPPDPVKPTACSTAGSAETILASRWNFSEVSWKELAWSTCIPPTSWPESCCGKKPLGTWMNRKTLRPMVATSRPTISRR